MNPNQYQCNNLLLSSGIEDNWRVAISPWVVLLRILEQMDQLHNLEYPVSILGVLASISRIGTAITIILSDRPEISLPQFCDGGRVAVGRYRRAISRMAMKFLVQQILDLPSPGVYNFGIGKCGELVSMHAC